MIACFWNETFLGFNDLSSIRKHALLPRKLMKFRAIFNVKNYEVQRAIPGFKTCNNIDNIKVSDRYLLQDKYEYLCSKTNVKITAITQYMGKLRSFISN